MVLGWCWRLGRINALFGKQTAFFGSVTALLGIVNAFLGKLSALSRQNGAVSLRSHHWISKPNPLDFKIKSIGFQNQTHWILKSNPLDFKTESIGFCGASKSDCPSIWLKLKSRFGESYRLSGLGRNGIQC